MAADAYKEYTDPNVPPPFGPGDRVRFTATFSVLTDDTATVEAVAFENSCWVATLRWDTWRAGRVDRRAAFALELAPGQAPRLDGHAREIATLFGC